MEELKAIVRKIRSGDKVPGYSLENDLLKGPDKWYKVQGVDRLRLVEVPIKKEEYKDSKIIKNQKKTKEKIEKIYLTERVCDCGKTFQLTKFNQNIFKCPECRKAKRRSIASVDRKFVCPDCGNEFVISKFQPYYNPERCQKCNRKKH